MKKIEYSYKDYGGYNYGDESDGGYGNDEGNENDDRNGKDGADYNFGTSGV